MVNNHKELYINITQLKENVILRYIIPNFTRDNNTTVLGRDSDLETTKKSILDIKEKYQPEKIYLSSIKTEGSSDEIYLKEYLEALFANVSNFGWLICGLIVIIFGAYLNLRKGGN